MRWRSSIQSQKTSGWRTGSTPWPWRTSPYSKVSYSRSYNKALTLLFIYLFFKISLHQKRGIVMHVHEITSMLVERRRKCMKNMRVQQQNMGTLTVPNLMNHFGWTSVLQKDHLLHLIWADTCFQCDFMQVTPTCKRDFTLWDYYPAVLNNSACSSSNLFRPD